MIPQLWKSWTSFLTGNDVGSLSSTSLSSSASDPPSHKRWSSTCSHRGRQAVELLPSYLADARAVDRYCPSTCPNGALQLGVAESQMLEDLLLPAIQTVAASPEQFVADCIYYQPTQGRASVRQAVTGYLEELLQLSSLDVDGLVIGAGCNAVLENLCVCLAEPGDAVMIPTPYYAAFEFDLVARAGLSVIPLTTMDYCGLSQATTTGTASNSTTIPVEAYYPTRDALEAGYEQAVLETGRPPRVLLLSHPHNPLGICYPAHVVQECIDWCREREVHLISDEIYAGSVYRKDAPVPFCSALDLAATPNADAGSLGLGPYIHWVYALSKDFALSGLRVGVAYSENEDIRTPLQKLNDLCQISSQTQQLVEGLLKHNDGQGTSWVSSFREKNHERLRHRGDALQKLLDELNIPYLPGSSGLFVWIDFSQFLHSNISDPQEQERTLYLELVNEFGLLLTPGLSMRNERPGFFRCVFTAAKDDEFSLALVRFRTFVNAKRNAP